MRTFTLDRKTRILTILGSLRRRRDGFVPFVIGVAQMPNAVVESGPPKLLARIQSAGLPGGRFVRVVQFGSGSMYTPQQLYNGILNTGFGFAGVIIECGDLHRIDANFFGQLWSLIQATPAEWWFKVIFTNFYLRKHIPGALPESLDFFFEGELHRIIETQFA